MPDNVPTDPSSDQEVFEDLYKQGRDRLLASLIGLVRDRDRAEDITAAAFQTAWEKRSQFRGESSLGTWVYAIAQNAARRSWRQERTAHRNPMDVLETRRHAEPDRLSARLEQDELRGLVWKALDRLPAKCRRLLIDRYIDGRSVQEIARREGVPIGTVGSRIFTATRLLRQAWDSATPRQDFMREQNIRQLTEDALDRLAALLEAGRSEVLQEYLAAQARFHKYSWGNVLLIDSQRPDATRVAGYHAWHDLGRFVKKGEKGIMIYAPVRVKDREQTPAAAPSQEPSRLAGFRTAYVFDVDQTEGRSLPEFAKTTGDPHAFADKLKAIVAKEGITLTYDPAIAPAQGVSSGGHIRLLPGLSPAEEVSVLAHELAHEIMHHGKEEPRLSKTVRETQAEAVAFVVCRGIGLDTHTAASDYIALYNGDKTTLAESLGAIHHAATRILNDLLPDERRAAPSRAAESLLDQERPTGRAAESGPSHASPGGDSQQPPDPSASLSWDR